MTNKEKTMIPFPLHLAMLQPVPRPQTSIERELAAIEARVARRPARPRLLRRAALRRLFRNAIVTAQASEITIRAATSADRPALARLAQLENQRLPRGAALVAEVNDRIVAGVFLRTTEAVADPFHARRDVVQLLEVRAAQLAA